MGADCPAGVARVALVLTARRFAQPGTLINPGAPTRDADDTTDLPGVPVETDVAADVWQVPQATSAELDDQGTVVTAWTGMFPPDAPVTAVSQWRETATNRLFQVLGQPEARNSLLTGLPDHIEARLKFISDQQGAPS